MTVTPKIYQYMDMDGNLGLGTTGPTVKLDVVGGIKASTTLNVQGLATFVGGITASGVTATTLNVLGASNYTGLGTFVGGITASGVTATTVTATTLNVQGLATFVGGITTSGVTATKLEINGTTNSGTTASPHIIIRSPTGSNTLGEIQWREGVSDSWAMGSVGSGANGTFVIRDYYQVNNPVRLAIMNNGNVGIGTTTPTVKLDVVGGIKASTTLSVGELATFVGGITTSGVTATTLNVLNTIKTNVIQPLVSGGTLSIKQGDGTEVLQIDGSGRLGIRMPSGVGFTGPMTITHTSAGTSMAGKTGYGGIHFHQSSADGGFVGMTSKSASSGTQGGFLIEGTNGTKLHLMTTNDYNVGMQHRVVVDQAGKVGIGTLTPTVALDVVGEARSSTSTTAGLGATTLTTKDYVDAKTAFGGYVAGATMQHWASGASGGPLNITDPDGTDVIVQTAQATTDIILMVERNENDTSPKAVKVYADTFSSPTTLRLRHQSSEKTSSNVTIPIPKGYYWKVASNGRNSGITKITWMVVGS